MAHLEILLAEFLDWQGMLVKRNVKVGKRGKGGWEGELDVVGYDPREKLIVHYELSLDAHPWPEREARYQKKMEAGQKYIRTELFPWLPTDVRIQQYAAFPTIGQRKTLAGAELLTVDQLVQSIVRTVAAEGVASKTAISEFYPLLRAIQLAVAGYSRAPSAA